MVNGKKRPLYINVLVVLIIVVILFVGLEIPNRVECAKAKSNNRHQEVEFDELKENSDSVVNAFIVAHSHCDLGWLETVNFYSKYNVTVIIDNVIKYLNADPQKRFIWSESGFLEMWWNNSTQTQRDAFKKLVHNKQIEIVNGGYVMTDEALPTYSAIIDQMTQGHQFVQKVIGADIQVGWQIDPFGASRTFAYLLSKMGFKYHVVDRIDERLKHKYREIPGSGTYAIEKHFEWEWCPSHSDPNSCIFTHVLEHHYSAPEICFNDGTCTGFDFESDPASNPPITNENIDARASLLVDYMRNVSKTYRTNNVLIPFGNDFRFQKANLMFDNMDLLISYINKNFQRFGVNMRYSTLSEYFEQVHNKTNPNVFPVKTYNSDSYSDYFPYPTCWGVDEDQFGDCIAYWSGYFVSEPQFKQLVRESERLLRNCEMIFTACQSELYKVETSLNRNIEKDLNQAEEALQYMRNSVALALHHDAITGTEKRFVLKNYTDIIQNATVALKNKTSLIFEYVATRGVTKDLLNVSLDQSLLLDEKKPIYALTLFNSLGWTTQEYIKIPVKANSISVYYYSRETGDVTQIDSDVVKEIDGTTYLYFKASVVPVGFSTYFIIQQDFKATTIEKKQTQYENVVNMENGYIKATFELTNGKLPYVLKSITNKYTGTTTTISQKIAQYVSYGDGAYILRTTGYAQDLVFETEYLDCIISNGKVVQSLSQRYTNNVTQTFVIYNEYNIPENGFVLDMSTSAQTGDNKEMITEFSLGDVQTTLYTDSNGYEMIERPYAPSRFNDSYFFNKIAGNYYPIVESSFIRSNDIQLTLFTRQAAGVASLRNGSIEFMLNRNTLTDDDRGLGENLNVTQTVTIPLRILLAPPSDSSNYRPTISKLFNAPALRMFSNSISLYASLATDSDIKEAVLTYVGKFNSESRFLNELPSNIHLLSLQTRNNVTTPNQRFTALRLQHIYEAQESLIHSKPVTLYPQAIFSDYFISNIVEMTMSLNYATKNLNFTKIILKPGEIRTFSLDLWNSEQGDDWFSISSFLFGAAAVIPVFLIVIVLISVTLSCQKNREISDSNHHNVINESTRFFERDE
ncbi:predicted protein [Naegleria gruberi]|uniref:Alpha-mannosidase n=1 Tax=Naegleria gruberi TaxID=5762 RepID=D2VQG0_NAEGR|nr:uncharacterized protein NAEGRDRAFT_58934 [Naegleria gruberi]EFC40940.1 predicted protein [Naegleria gruberi]|eukprot:XP_002673684.1 predicted protein [Naegleria gruberi strain NEG-M]